MKNLEEQALIVIRALEAKKYEKTSPILDKALEWVARWPQALDLQLRERLLRSITSAFDLSEAEIFAKLEGLELDTSGEMSHHTSEDTLRRLIPKDSWLEKYCLMTDRIESPLSYHVFTALTVLGCAMGRRVSFDMGGFFSIYPSMSCILIGPTGKTHKSSAVSIGQKLVTKLQLCGIMPDKITPEAFLSALKDNPEQLVYAPELVVFFGKQNYNEGMISNILRLLDFPDTLTVSTLGRGEETIHAPTLHFLGASTMSLLTSNAPAQLLDSGFLNRFLLVVEERTERIFPIPAMGDQAPIRQRLADIKSASGICHFDPAANDMHRDWYFAFKKEIASADESVAALIQRAQTHIIRIAMNLHIADHGSLAICPRCLETAINIVNHVSRSVPSTAVAITKNQAAQETSFVVRQLHILGGAADHSTLLRRVSSRMNTRQLRTIITTLEESGIVKVGRKGSGQYYILIKEAE